MKAQSLTIIFLIQFLIGNLVAQEDTVYFRQTCSNYIRCLQSKNDGVVSSTLINLMQLKYHYRHADCYAICGALDSLAVYGKTDRIKSLSRIVLAYFQQRLDLDWLAKQHYLEIHAYFDLLLNDKIVQTVTYYDEWIEEKQ